MLHPPVFYQTFMRNFHLIIFVTSICVGAFAAGPERTKGKRRRGPWLVKRDAVVRAVLLDNPTWTARQVHQTVTPLLATAGLTSISFDTLRHQLTRIAKEAHIKRAPTSVKPEHVAYLNAQFARDPSQTPATVWAQFCLVWGPDAEEADRITTWWYKTRHNLKQKQPTGTPVIPRAPSPSSQQTVPSASSALDLPTDWWTLGEEFDRFLAPQSSGGCVTET